MSAEQELPASALQHMARALELAGRGLGRTAPNPPVGAVLVRDGEVVGEGYHPAAGQPHAEIFALQDAGARARGADLYVTLEPCCHQGRTGPCTEALIAAGVRRVFYGVVDPNPKVAGAGLQRLRTAGIATAAAPLAADCRRLIAPFAKHVRTGLPFVTLKAAMTLDGQLATSTGESQWITGEASRAAGHRLRSQVDAILTGAGTVLADDPRLTVRLADGGRNPARVVLDGALRTSPQARVYSASTEGRRLLFTAADAVGAGFEEFRAAGVEVCTVPRQAGHLDLAAVMTQLGAFGVQSLLVEAGGALNGALWRAGLVDRLVLFVAPRLFGGSDGTPLFAGVGVARLAAAWQLTDLRVDRCGDDLMVEGEVSRCSPA
jgi:diaminohydroxyphosphoribosylaminopyrimidine deaminase/5-amino-6-(5-phosphoribosylamino)uracil reductase